LTGPANNLRMEGRPVRYLLIPVLALGLLPSCGSTASSRPAPAAPEQPSITERAAGTPDSAPAPNSRPAPAAATKTPPKPEPRGLKELLPGVRADLAAKVVEFDGIVPINCHDPRTPDVYLEVVVCTPDTKEHESLVMTKAKASDVHAALLAVGLEPGAPGRWDYKEKKFTPVPPRGAAIEVLFAYKGADGKVSEVPATDWIVNASTKGPFVPAAGDPGGGWVFAGSKMAKHEGHEVYDADGVGTLVGLCTFGSETVAWKRVISPDSEVNEPEWIADAGKVPAYGTPVTVRIRPATAK
jgi:hypothetical protein